MSSAFYTQLLQVCFAYVFCSYFNLRRVLTTRYLSPYIFMMMWSFSFWNHHSHFFLWCGMLYSVNPTLQYRQQWLGKCICVHVFVCCVCVCVCVCLSVCLSVLVCVKCSPNLIGRSTSKLRKGELEGGRGSWFEGMIAWKLLKLRLEPLGSLQLS